MNTNEENRGVVNETDLTREINLDELYDGAINNTTIIDPITNNEVFLENKRPNYPLIGIVFAILVLLVLYYVNNKTDLTKKTPEVIPNTTSSTNVVTTTVAENNYTGVLNCSYDSKSDSETQSIKYILNYENNKLLDSEFTYVVTSNIEALSATIEDLKNQYETLYINNASLVNNKITFEKDEKGFTFVSKVDYKLYDFSETKIEEGKTIMYVKPTLEDTYENLKEKYEKNGFTCALAEKDNSTN